MDAMRMCHETGQESFMITVQNNYNTSEFRVHDCHFSVNEHGAVINSYYGSGQSGTNFG
jgi:hypothetical protein